MIQNSLKGVSKSLTLREKELHHCIQIIGQILTIPRKITLVITQNKVPRLKGEVGNTILNTKGKTVLSLVSD